MSVSTKTLKISKQGTARLTEHTLSDNSHVYNVQIFDSDIDYDIAIELCCHSFEDADALMVAIEKHTLV